MNDAGSPSDGGAGLLRTLLLLLLIVGMSGTLVELFLLEHTEGRWQWVPIVLLSVAIVVSLVTFLSGKPMAVRGLRWMMLILILSGVAGLYHHYTGNMEFELEMRPAIAGWDLIRESLMGATPALAPGVMIQFGLLGWIYGFRHPALRAAGDSVELEGGES